MSDRWKGGFIQYFFDPLDPGPALPFGPLYSWGGGGSVLGQNGGPALSSPTQVGALVDWVKVSGKNEHVLAVKYDNTLWAWGANNRGQLGIDSIANQSSPTQVGALTDWYMASAGSATVSGATKTDGTLWTWGRWIYGSLGRTDGISRSSPVQVGALTNWLEVSCGDYHMLAVKTNGTIWSWGYNSDGQLGLNIASTVNRSSPVQIGSLTTWSKVSTGGNTSAAIQTNGTLWTWGFNGQGQLGLNDITTKRSSPVQVGALTNWSEIAVGKNHMLAIKTDGTLWAWGYNDRGQLGDGTVVDKSSPVQIGALVNWSKISVSSSATGILFSMATKTDGTLWTWGGNTSGQLGDGTVVNRSSPVQIGSGTTWNNITACGISGLATQTS